MPATLHNLPFSPPFDPGGGYFHHHSTDEETAAQRTQAQGHTAGKWQNWGLDQSFWSLVHVSPSLLVGSFVSSRLTGASVRLRNDIPGQRGTGWNGGLVWKSMPAVGAILVTTPPLMHTLCYVLTKHPYLIWFPQFPRRPCSRELDILI